MAKRKIGKVLWLALQCAKGDRQSLIDAYSGDTSEDAVKKALADVRAFESLQIRLFGTSKTELEKMMDSITPVSVLKMLSEDIDDAEQKMHPITR